MKGVEDAEGETSGTEGRKVISEQRCVRIAGKEAER